MNKSIVLLFAFVVIVLVLVVGSLAPVKRAISNVERQMVSHAQQSDMNTNSMTQPNPLSNLWDAVVAHKNGH